MEISNNPDELAEGISAHKHSQGLVYMRRFLELQIVKYQEWLEREEDHKDIIRAQAQIRECRNIYKLIGE